MPSASETASPQSGHSGRRFHLNRLLVASARWVFACLLLLATGAQLWKELQKLQGREIRFSTPQFLLSGILYAAALACFAGYWRQAALHMGARTGILESQRAYFASQLGKYIPGKAWVVLIRCGLTDRRTSATAVIIASTFYETLAMMAAGAFLALILFLVSNVRSTPILMAAAGLAAALSLAVLPPVFRRLVSWTSRPFQKERTPLVAAVTYGIWLKGYCYFLPGWALAGASLITVANSVEVSLNSAPLILLATGATALSMVGGFAILVVPAGLGVREWIVMQTLAFSIGAGNAGLIAILARIMNTAVELLVAGCLYPVRMRKEGK